MSRLKFEDHSRFSVTGISPIALIQDYICGISRQKNQWNQYDQAHACFNVELELRKLSE